jgi:hypothetical protein
MRSRLNPRILLFACALWLSGIAAAQDTTPPTAQPQGGETPAGQPQSGETPAAATGSTDADANTGTVSEQPLSIFGDAMSGHLAFSGEADARYEYDDNVLASNVFRFSDNITNISGRLSAAVQKKKLQFQIHYAPSYRIYADLDERNAFSHQFANEIEYRFGARTTLRWAGLVSDMSTSASPPFSFASFGGTIIAIYHPSALQTDTRVLHSNGSLGLEHNFTARSGVHVTAHGATTNFFEENNVPLVNSRAREQFSSGATAGWNYEYVQGKKVGVEAGYSYYGFLEPAAHSNYEFIKLRYERLLGKGFSFRVGAGPSFQQSQSALQKNNISYDIDVSLARQTAKYNVVLAYNKGNRLGSAQGTLTTDQASIVVGSSFRRRWNTTGSFGYSRSSQPQLRSQNLESISTSAQLGYALSPTLRAYTQYSFVNQFGRSGLFSLYNFDRSVFAFGIGYSFGAAARR